MSSDSTKKEKPGTWPGSTSLEQQACTVQAHHKDHPKGQQAKEELDDRFLHFTLLVGGKPPVGFRSVPGKVLGTPQESGSSELDDQALQRIAQSARLHRTPKG